VGLHAGPARLQEFHELRHRNHGDADTREVRIQPFQVHANPLHLWGRDVVLFKLVLLRGDILGGGISEQLLVFRLAIVRHREIDVEGKRLGVTGQTVEDRLSLAHLLGGQNGRNRVQSVGRVQCLEFEHGLLGGGLFRVLKFCGYGRR